MSAAKVSKLTDKDFDLAFRELLVRGGYEQTLREFMAKSPSDREIRQQLTLGIGRRADSTHGIIALQVSPKLALYWGSYGGNGIKPALEGPELIAKVRELFAPAANESKPDTPKPDRWDGSELVRGDARGRRYCDLTLVELEEGRVRDTPRLSYEDRSHVRKLRDEYNRFYEMPPNKNGVYVGCEGVERIDYQHRTGAEIKIALLDSPAGWLVAMSIGVKGTGTGSFGSSEPLSAVDVYETREAALKSRLERVAGHCGRNQSDSKKVAEAKNLMRKWAKAQLEKIKQTTPLVAATAATVPVESLTLQPTLFDYSTLDTKTAEAVQYAASEIKRLYKLTVESAIEIGKHLRDVKRRLHGRYTEWLRAEFAMSERTARDFVNMADEFENRELPQNLSLTVVRTLAQPSTPRAAREEVTRRAEAGEKITVEETEEIVTRHTDKRWRQTSITDVPGVVTAEAEIVAGGLIEESDEEISPPVIDQKPREDANAVLVSQRRAEPSPSPKLEWLTDLPGLKAGLRVGSLAVVRNQWSDIWHIEDESQRVVEGSKVSYPTLQEAIDDAINLQVEEVIEVLPDPANNPRQWLREKWTRSRLILTVIVEAGSGANREVQIKASMTGHSAERRATLEELINFERGPVAATLNELRKNERKRSARSTVSKKAKSRKARA